MTDKRERRLEDKLDAGEPAREPERRRAHREARSYAAHRQVQRAAEVLRQWNRDRKGKS